MPNVYIVNKTCHDHSDAERFGTLIALSEGAMNRYNTSNIFRAFMPVLKGSTADDYILPSGLTVMSNIACAIFGMLHGRLNLLIFRPGRDGDGRYIERKIVLDETYLDERR